MTKLKSFIQNNIKIISIITSIVFIIIILLVIIFSQNKTVEVAQPLSSEQTSSEETSSKTKIVVPDIIENSSVAPPSSTPPIELKVEGDPASKVTESKPAEKQKDTSSKTSSKPKENNTTQPKQSEGIDAETQKILDELGFTDGAGKCEGTTGLGGDDLGNGGYH